MIDSVTFQNWLKTDLQRPRSQPYSPGLASTSYGRRESLGVSIRTAAAGRASPSETIGIARNTDSQSSDRIELPRPATLRAEAKQDKIAICDKIIRIFLEKPSSQWRKLIAFSKQWSTLHESLFSRLEQRAKTSKDSKDRTSLKKLQRQLKEVHEELQGYNTIMEKIQKSPERDWEGLVALGRASFSIGFFEHMENLVRAYHDDPVKRDELASMASRLLVIVEQWDKAAENADSLKAAGEEFSRLMEQAKSIEDAELRIDELARSGKLDPALMLTMAKAYASAKDTDYTKEEVKDVMAHLYFKAKESFAAQQPASVRILKHLLWIESPKDRLEALGQSFERGPQLSTDKEDYLNTTPEELEMLMTQILQAYESSTKKDSMQAEANSLMSPEVINRMRDLLAALQKHYL